MVYVITILAHLQKEEEMPLKGILSSSFFFKKVFRTFLKVFFRGKPYCDTESYKDFRTFSAP